MRIFEMYPATFKSIVYALCLAVLVVPFMQSRAQDSTRVQTSEQPDVAKIKIQAEADAEADVSSTPWFFIGCLLGVIGWVIAIATTPEVPTERLVGKSADYVALYSEMYKEKAKSIRTKGACTGWGVSVAVAAVAVLILYAVVSKDLK